MYHTHSTPLGELKLGKLDVDPVRVPQPACPHERPQQHTTKATRKEGRIFPPRNISPRETRGPPLQQRASVLWDITISSSRERAR